MPIRALRCVRLRRPPFRRARASTAPAKAWVPNANAQEPAVRRADAATAMLHDFNAQHHLAAQQLVPWFLGAMPGSYFRQVPRQEQLDHLKAVNALYNPQLPLQGARTAAQDDVELRVVTKKEGQRDVTFVRVGDRPGALLRQVRQLTRATGGDGALSQVKVFTSKDGGLCLNVFAFETDDRATSAPASTLLHEAYALERGEDVSGVRNHAAKCDARYVETTSPARWALQRRLFETVDGSEHVAVHVEAASLEDPEDARPARWVVVAAPNTLPFSFLQKQLRVLGAAKLDVQRCHLDVVRGNAGPVVMLRTLVVPHDVSEEVPWAAVEYSLRRIKWLDDAVLDVAFDDLPRLLAKTAWLPTALKAGARGAFSMDNVERCEVSAALLALAHRELGGSDGLAFSLAAVRNVAFSPKYFGVVFGAAELVRAGDVANKAALVAELLSQVELATAGVDSAAREVLRCVVRTAAGASASNLGRQDRFALALQLDSAHGCGNGRPQPYGVVSVHGRRFDAYHVRFRKIARGGLRLVTPRFREAHAHESARHFDECYNLANAQQMKNKDIPEGGAKGVILVDASTPAPTDAWAGQTCTDYHDHICRKAVKACTDALLDVVLANADDLLYLGPDEQITPVDIDWVISNAKRRGHPIPDSFMSSKPNAGINHKEFGVTSEGVHVFLEAALRDVGLDPRFDDFTVKLTGGPDGDVAGNALNVLFRDCAKARVVGVADASGVAEDPAGLDRAELLRLFKEALPIAHFDASKLSEQGVVLRSDTDAGAQRRDSMHNRVQADVFVPAGGRPATMNVSNYKAFIHDGVPSSKIIVEGANLFVTPEARSKLHSEFGVRIVKDSSANKCGVICSSFEILAAHVLTRAEFEAQKPELVGQILEKLRTLARLEADLVFREAANFPGALPEFSLRISSEINAVTDAVALHLSKCDDDSALVLFRDLVDSHLPRILAKATLGQAHRLPEGYCEAAVGAWVASRLVYSEGVHFVESLPRDRLAKIALRFLDAQRGTAAALDALSAAEQLSDGDREHISNLLKRGGARAGLKL